MALDSPHFLANMINHRFLGERPQAKQKEQDSEYLSSINTDFVPFVVATT